MKYRPWYERFPSRLESERQDMHARDFSLDEDAFRSERRVQFRGKSVNGNFSLTVVYPDAFPSKSPRVFSSQDEGILRRHHRVDNREICTFAPGQGRWRATLSGASALDEAELVIAAMTAPADTSDGSDDVPEPASATYIYPSRTHVLIPPSVANFVAKISVGASVSFKIRFINWPGQRIERLGAGRGVITAVGDNKEGLRAPEIYESLVQGSNAFEFKGKLLRLSEPPPVLTGAELSNWVRKQGHRNQEWMAFLFPEQSGNASTFRLGWLLVRPVQHGIFECIRAFAMDGTGRNARMPGLDQLPTKSAVFIGCGSLGSKIAANLAAAGIQDFRLVDFDFLEPDNAVRHELGVDFFGFDKNWALHQRLMQLNPDAAKKGRLANLIIGGLNAANIEAEFQQLLASASVVIETTGDHGVSRFINDICGELKVPQVYASVTNGAWGGEVVRFIPGRTACWMCWVRQYEGRQPASEPAPAVGVFAPGCDQPTFTGTGYELGIVAGIASSFIVDTLFINDQNRKHFVGDYVRWQMRNSDGDLVPTIEVLEVNKDKQCPFCGE